MPKSAIAAALSIPALKRRGFSRIWIKSLFVFIFHKINNYALYLTQISTDKVSAYKANPVMRYK
jgi:hypothetical protein